MENHHENPHFIICSPRQFCGGPIALHALCKYLSGKGFDASIYYIFYDFHRNELANTALYIFGIIKDWTKLVLVRLSPSKYLRSRKFLGYNYFPVKGCKRKFTRIYNKKNTIVIYPEIIYGNPLHAKQVVRWLLYYSNNSKTTYGEDDLCIAYRKVFNDPSLNPDCKVAEINYFDLSLYKQSNFGERAGTCYILRKGATRDDLPTHFDGPIIDNLSEEEIVEVFNQCQYCVSYDMQTAYSDIASLCGCISIIVPEKDKNIFDYRSNDESLPGVAFGFSDAEIERAIKTRPDLIKKYENLETKNNENVDKFIQYCMQYFKIEKE